MRLLEGHVEVLDERDEQIERLERENRELRDELSAAKREARNARKEAAGALLALRKQLSPLYRALQAVFGELDAAGVDENAQSGTTNVSPRTAEVWNAWKSRLGTSAKVIDALLLHGEMNTQQLAIATGFHRTTIPAHIFKLNKAGLLNKNGGKFSLKQL